MSKVRNALICFGLFWLSLWLVVPLSWFFSRFTDGIPHQDDIPGAISMGILMSLGRSFAAGLAGVLATLTVASKKPDRWAPLIAALYVIDAPVRHHWNFPATSWDRLWQGIDLVFPAIVCVAAAFVTSRLRQRASALPSATQPN